MKTPVKLLVLLSLVAALSTGCSTVTYVPVDPPVAKTEVRTTKPSGNYVWVSGHWKWDGHRYVWADGYWKKQKAGGTWVAGHWKKTPRGHIWVSGHWS